MAWLALVCGAGMLLLLHYKYSSARVPPAPPTHAAHKIAAQVVLNRKEAAKAEKGRIIESAHKLAKATDLNTHEIVDKMNQPADEYVGSCRLFPRHFCGHARTCQPPANNVTLMFLLGHVIPSIDIRCLPIFQGTRS